MVKITLTEQMKTAKEAFEVKVKEAEKELPVHKFWNGAEKLSSFMEDLAQSDSTGQLDELLKSLLKKNKIDCDPDFIEEHYFGDDYIEMLAELAAKNIEDYKIFKKNVLATWKKVEG